MKMVILKRFFFAFAAMLPFLSAAAQSDYTVAPIFSWDRGDVVTMYCSPNAELFYLHTSDTLFVLNATGEQQSARPSEPLYGCNDGKDIYTHADEGSYILNFAEDTVMCLENLPTKTNEQHSPIHAKWMDKADGIYYMYRGREGYRGNEIIVAAPDTTYRHSSAKPQGATGVAIAGGECYYCVCLPKTNENGGEDGSRMILLHCGLSDGDTVKTDTIEGMAGTVGLEYENDAFYTYSNTDKKMYHMTPHEKPFTSIRSAVSPDDQPLTYDLQGRPVAEPQHGIYIQNGKKVLKR